MDCNPLMKCSDRVILQCPVNLTIDVILETDVFIYQRDASDGLVNTCSSTGRDCLVDHSETLTHTVTDVLPNATVPEHNTCQGRNYCEVQFYLKSPLEETQCTGRHYVFVNYTCVMPGRCERLSWCLLYYVDVDYRNKKKHPNTVVAIRCVPKNCTTTCDQCIRSVITVSSCTCSLFQRACVVQI